jgi:hypothetical protein
MKYNVVKVRTSSIEINYATVKWFRTQQISFDKKPTQKKNKINQDMKIK